MNASHPLIVLPTKANVFQRRPRLTNQEALILNMLVNADGEPVTLGAIVANIYRGQHIYNSYYKSVRQVISTLRAKLGEEAWRPTQIQTVYAQRKGRAVLAYRWHDIEREC